MWNIFGYQIFGAISGNHGGKVPVAHDVLSSHEPELWPSTLLDENCIEYEFHMDRNFYVDLISNSLSEPFFTGRMKLLSRPDGFMLYGKLGCDFFSTSELLYANKKIRIQIIRDRPISHMISDNSNLSLGIVDCSLYTRRIDLKFDYPQRLIRHACKYCCSFQLFGDSSKGFHHYCQKEAIHSGKFFQHCSNSSNCHCNEYKLSAYWIVHWKSILVSTIWSQTHYNTHKKSANYLHVTTR